MTAPKIGDTLWRFDYNRRQYTVPGPRERGRFGDLIYRGHFAPYTITGEVKESWIVEIAGKVGKRTVDRPGAFWFSTAGMEAKIYVHDNRHKIADAGRACTDAELLPAPVNKVAS